MPSIDVLVLSLTASGSVPARRFVGPTGAVATAAGNALGVSRYAVSDGDEAPVTVLGTEIVEAGGVVARGASIEVGAGGKAVTLDEGAKVAVALTAAAADGDEIEVLLIAN